MGKYIKKSLRKNQPASQPDNQAMPDQPAKIITSAGGIDGSGNLEAVAARIERERMIDGAKQQFETAKENKLLAGPATPPAPVSLFIPSDEVKQIAAGITFYVTKKIVYFMAKELKPMDRDQETRLKDALGRLMEKYVPAAMAKYQDSGEIVLVLGGIVISNMTDIKPPGQPTTPGQKIEKQPTAPELPTAETVFLGPATP